ncbi:guanylate kinase [Eggerthellaceae bacterium zg-1084]|uniref:Guanylate kinase n=1 Tax=Berryella wangjianweii TaxID=2734634 RepID=A0A6M8J0C0_9ACTN|nr:guanylate kinase [Berryella wangjianweii]NPD30325.1 guanylate kinase [Berryella wangjianweii]QKF07007.1 guanylate kinase [Berryella wangjianweii]
MRRGNLYVISGPSGAGKGTLVARLVEQLGDAWVSVSATTRAPRPGERDGEHYFFLSRERFEAMVREGGLLEWAEFSGNLYGTPRASVEQHMAAGQQVILEIEVQGAFQVRAQMPEAHLVFIEPPSLDELERRLVGRGTETPESVRRRMETATLELQRKNEYDYCLVNDDLEQAAQDLLAFVNGQAEEQSGDSRI